MPNGFGRGFGRGMGFGFRGSSPPWPFVGLGRGGLPRCGYFLSGAAGIPMPWGYQQAPYPAYGVPATTPGVAPFALGYQQAPYSFYGAPATAPGAAPFSPQMAPEQELDFLKDQAQAIKGQLEQIEARMRELETGK